MSIFTQLINREGRLAAGRNRIGCDVSAAFGAPVRSRTSKTVTHVTPRNGNHVTLGRYGPDGRHLPTEGKTRMIGRSHAIHRPQPGTIALIAPEGSAVAEGVAAELAEHWALERVRPDGHTERNAVAAVVLIEHESAIDALRITLERWRSPVLVLAATRRLAEDVLPCLHAHHDLATAAESASVLLWRLQRLVDLASRPAAEPIELNARRLAAELATAREEANLCSLTGLHNRRYFDTQLASEIERARSQGATLSLAFVDLDFFHFVNTTYGLPTGDRVLKAFASVVRAAVRSTDWVARCGGDEFVIVMPDTALDSAMRVVERVRREFQSTMIESMDGRRVAATLSAGVAQASGRTMSAAALVQLASIGLQRAKGAGRNLAEAAA
jgi:diguanylate cyclase (GGDEF)-like protein